MRSAVAALVGFVSITVGVSARDTRLAGWFELTAPGGEATLVALGIALVALAG